MHQLNYASYNAEGLKLTDAEIAWFTAIVEGEGCITTRVTKRKNGNLLVVPCILISNTDALIIDECVRICELMGVKVYTHWRKRKQKANHNECCNIKVDGIKHIKQMATYMLPFFKSSKKGNMLAILKFIEMRESHLLVRDSLGRIVRNKYRKEELEIIAPLRHHINAMPLSEMLLANNII